MNRVPRKKSTFEIPEKKFLLMTCLKLTNQDNQLQSKKYPKIAQNPLKFPQKLQKISEFLKTDQTIGSATLENLPKPIRSRTSKAASRKTQNSEKNPKITQNPLKFPQKRKKKFRIPKK